MGTGRRGTRTGEFRLGLGLGLGLGSRPVMVDFAGKRRWSMVRYICVQSQMRTSLTPPETVGRSVWWVKHLSCSPKIHLQRRMWWPGYSSSLNDGGVYGDTDTARGTAPTFERGMMHQLLRDDVPSEQSTGCPLSISR